MMKRPLKYLLPTLLLTLGLGGGGLTVSAQAAPYAEQTPQGLLAKFQDVFISDNTIATLQDSLQKLFPGVSTKAGLKIHAFNQGLLLCSGQTRCGCHTCFNLFGPDDTTFESASVIGVLS